MATKTAIPIIKLPGGKAGGLFSRLLKDRSTEFLVERGGLGFGIPGTHTRLYLPGPIVKRLLAQIEGLQPKARVRLLLDGKEFASTISTLKPTALKPEVIQINPVWDAR